MSLGHPSCGTARLGCDRSLGRDGTGSTCHGGDSGTWHGTCHPSKPALLTQNKPRHRSELVMLCSGVMEGPSLALPAASSECWSFSKSTPPWWESSSSIGSTINQGWVVMVALGGVPWGGNGPPGLGKNQAGGVGNRSRPQYLFTVIKNPRHHAGPDAGNGEFTQNMGQLVV